MKRIALLLSLLSLLSSASYGQSGLPDVLRAMDARADRRPTPTEQLAPLPALIANPEQPKKTFWEKVKQNKWEIILDGVAMGSALFANEGIAHCREHFDVDGCNGQYGHRKQLAIVRTLGTAAVIPLARYWKALDDETETLHPGRSWIRLHGWTILPLAAAGVNFTAGAKAFSHRGDEWMRHNPNNP